MNKLIKLDSGKIDLIKRTIGLGFTNDELDLFVGQCQRTGLDPIQRQIYGIKQPGRDGKEGKFIISVSIDGFRLIAERSGKYAGQTQPLFCEEDGIWREFLPKGKLPFACKVSVLRKDFSEPLTAVVKFDSYAQKTSSGLSYTWAKFPETMISKCCEALALRKAFPNEMSGLYAQEELGNIDPPEKELNTAESKPKELPKPVQKNKALLKLDADIKNAKGFNTTEENIEALKLIFKNWKTAKKKLTPETFKDGNISLVAAIREEQEKIK